MDRQELLKQLGLTGEELRDFLSKFANFQRDLNPAQLKVLVHSLPSVERASRTLGTTADNLAELFREESDRATNFVLCGFEGIDDINHKK